MTIKLDLKDRKILYELDIDSRQSASRLAKKVGISKQGCTLKIHNLVKKGVIRSFPAVINTALLGYLSFRMYFKLIDIPPEKEEEFREFLINHNRISWLVGCEGAWDYICVVFPSDFKDFERFAAELNNTFGQYIERKDIALVTVAHHFRSGYILDEKKDMSPLVYAGQPSEVITIDEMEKKILKILAGNARKPIVEIGRELNLPGKTVAYRVEKLCKNGLLEGFTVAVNLDEIGFERYKLFIRTKNIGEKKEKTFIEYARRHPHILYYSKSIGNNDVELELVVKDSGKLHEIVAEIRVRFKELIKSYEVLKIFKEYKLNFYPW